MAKQSKSAADVAMQVEMGLSSSSLDSIPTNGLSKAASLKRGFYVQELTDRLRFESVTVKRFQRLNPETDKSRTADWWATDGDALFRAKATEKQNTHDENLTRQFEALETKDLRK